MKITSLLGFILQFPGQESCGAQRRSPKMIKVVTHDQVAARGALRIGSRDLGFKLGRNREKGSYLSGKV